MPARKSDVRRSDVSVARFVLADEDSTMATDSPATEPTPTPAPAAPAPAEPSAPGSISSPQQQQQPSEKKDKEKDKERDREREREKERERERDALSIEDLALPKSIITRLAKGVLPPNTQIQANAILALTKSATVFISHLANAANESTVASNKKTIMPADVFKALDDIEYGFMRERLEAEFAKFNQVQTSKRSTYRKKVAAAKKAGGTSQSTDAGAAADMSMMSIASGPGGDAEGAARAPRSPGSAPGEPPAAKKARLDPAAAGDEGMELDEEDGVSDAETVPEEEAEEEEEDEEETVEEDEEEEEEDGEGGDEEGDELEERVDREDEDEALDDDSD
ncbi:histone-fold-containing protein [Staphylotrichum tortipilum]|uniref:DNA polymerase epsilon subunit D n=1 Tax=Staphylotrichum tortipilum TaxID=2831512 RepID=A0AAN6MKD9_9PEZI|nr:histone-fold-containing protein [Staphylotrichum longicolle]